MAMSSDTNNGLSYREQTVHTALEEHDNRISANERRWLMVKGAVATLAAVEGINFATAELITLV